MSLRHLHSRGLVNLVPAVLGLCLSTLVGCGGAQDRPAKAAEAKTDGAQASATNTAAPAPPPVEGPKPAVEAAGAKEKFALPNVELKSPEDREKVTLGGKELTAEVCWLDTSAPELKHEWFSQAIRSMVQAADGALIVLDHEHKVRRYLVQPGEACKLALDPAFGKGGVLAFPSEIDWIAVQDDGTIVGFEFMKLHRYKDGKIETFDCSAKTVEGNGKTGWNSFSDEVEMVDIANDCKKVPWKYAGWEGPEKPSVQFVRPWGKDVILAASVKGTHYVAIHGRDGKKKIQFGKDSDDKTKKEGETICWARDADACGAGVCVLDSNCRNLTAWDPKKGTLVGVVDINRLLGVSYAWPVDLAMGKGVAYLAASHKERKPENAPKDYDAKDVGMIFRIRGLD